MAGSVQSDSNSNGPMIFALDLAGTDRYSWRLRAKPCIDSEEIDEFRHEARIEALRDAAHPGWLKLLDESGWVKEAHEDRLVWKPVQFHAGAQVTTDLDSNLAASCTASEGGKAMDGVDASSSSSSKCIADVDESSNSPTFSRASSSESSSAFKGNTLARGFPLPFQGASYSIGVKGNAGPVIANIESSMRWFTGPSYKISDFAFLEAADSVQKASRETRPLWADMEDSDEETAFDVCDFLGIGKVHWQSIDASNVNAVGSIATQQTVGMQEALNDQLPKTQVADPPFHTKRVARKSNRRQARNKNILHKKNKTEMCGHLIQKGFCPFGDACWFAHSESELQPVVEDIIAETLDNESKLDDKVEPKTAAVVENSYRHSRNKDWLNKRNRTQLCRYLSDQGCCPFGDTCWFAHSADEVRANAESRVDVHDYESLEILD